MATMRASRLLIVEDERIVAMDLRALLEELGYDVVGIATSCEEALTKCTEATPDLALMDIRIKGKLDGIQTAAMLRAQHQVPVVYLTANADQATLGRALETEPGGFLPKPYNSRALRTTIEVALRRHGAESTQREAHTLERRRFEERSNDLLALADRLSREASTDPLTQLHNRRYLNIAMTEQLRIAERDGIAVGVILLDIDNFKQVNDKWGHLVGDRVLSRLGGLLRSCLRDHDIACRYGGEEMMLVISGASLYDSFALAERLRMRIAELSFDVDGRKTFITVSLGVSAFPEHGLDAESLIRAADSALYRAKGAGRNRVIAASI